MKRLVVCLDGTWNRRDSSTNVLHHYNLVRKGTVPDGSVQKKWYHLGVGTGVLDSVTGGAFGFGLENNVRDAYNWLVEQYCDAEGQAPDEIYIFGFSRGAYTARSLVGFIAQCGLLRRGAPLTVEQLWRRYCILGRQKEERTSIWETILGKDNPQIRSYTALQRAKDLTRQDRLLLKFSRRVDIRYLGIYDTVGALGWDALAIPGLTSRVALHNNTRPTTIIQHCRHALAIDENRSNFKHTPFIAYLQEDSDEYRRTAGLRQSTIEQNREIWQGKIEQRWFVGAHSNIGGGYPDDLMAQSPLEWIMEGSALCGLLSEASPAPECLTKHDGPKDSYAEFLPPLWETIIRNKRNFRMIDPAQQLLASRNPSQPGFALETIQEVVDPTVGAFWKNSGRPIPPNFECYLKRHDGGLPEGFIPAQHVWIRDGFFGYTALAVWTMVAVFGAYALDSLGGFTSNGLPWWLTIGAALALPVIDWGESKVTFVYAAGKSGPLARAFLDAVYWTRTVGFLLFVFGLVYGVGVFFVAGLRRDWPISNDFLNSFGAVAVLAGLPALVITKLRSKYAWGALLEGPILLAFVSLTIFVLGATIKTLFPQIHIRQFWTASGPASLPGRLLLLQLIGIYFWRSLVWVGEPLAKANLSSITKLQRCFRPQQVMNCLNEWRDKLANTVKLDRSPTGPPADCLRKILREALWRDIIGFIPVYTMFLLFGLNFAALLHVQQWGALVGWLPIPNLAETIRLHFTWMKPYWWVLPVLAAAADYLEDRCHLYYCKLYEKEAAQASPSAGLTLFSFWMTIVKYVCFVTAEFIITLAVLAGTLAMFESVQDWRARCAIVITGLGLVAVASTVAAFMVGTIRKRRLQTKKPLAINES